MKLIVYNLCFGAHDFHLVKALKLERVNSNIKFLKQCKRRKVIPEGLTVANKELNDNTNFSGFKNLSAVEFSREENDLLSKGPSYIPPPLIKSNLNFSLKFKAELQACHDRLSKNDSSVASSPEMMEFLTSVNSITSRALKNMPNSSVSKTISSIRNKSCYIYPSDKTKRLIALDYEHYDNIVKQSLNPDNVSSRPVLPTTRQLNFNSALQKVANRYDKKSVIRNSLESCKVTDPLPSFPYALPKDHKSGDLKGRPIISSCNSTVKGLSVMIANILMPLVEEFVSAHLKSTEDFLSSISSITIPPNAYFFSLDVTNLYGSIPIKDTPEHPGLISVVTEFFEIRKYASLDFQSLTKSDFETLLTLCLSDDVYLHEDKFFKQISGIAMGNNAAPPLAIIYMDYIERQIISSVNEISFWKRNIDDVFSISICDPESVLNTVNSISPYIKFTLELPNADNELPFLDVLVMKNSSTFSYKLYVKPTHSGTCIHFSSFTPASRKINLVNTELDRASKCSSDPSFEIESRALITQKFKDNKYPSNFIFRRNKTLSDIETVKTDTKTFIKVPYLSEAQKSSITRIHRRLKLHDTIRLVFTTEKSLSWLFRKCKPIQVCNSSCISCSTSEKPKNCFVKFAVYKITCKICNSIYIGQTSRIMRNRILEHVNKGDTHVSFHIASHNPQASSNSISWRVLATEPSYYKRIALEALFIEKHSRYHTLINGCKGRELLNIIT